MRSLAEIQATLDYEAALAKSNPELADKLLKLTGKMSDSDKKKLLHYEGKMKLWTGIGKEAQKVMGRPDAECSTHFISALKAWSSKKHENCKTGIENQNKKIVRNAVSMVLCAAIVASVAITIALQASSSGGLWGLPSHSAPFLALSIGTSVLYLTEFVVRIHFDKKKMRAEAPNFHHHHGPAACDRRDLHAHRYSIV
jgi:hypothetical protein